MEYRLPCECGQHLFVTEGAAGATLHCACGRSLQVPSLDELRSHLPGEAEVDIVDKGALSPAHVVLLAVGAVVFGALFLAGLGASFAAGGLAGVAYLVAQVGQIWLLVLIVRECRPDAIVMALVIPFFTWYFAYQRWDIAKWALACNASGLLLTLFAACVGAPR